MTADARCVVCGAFVAFYLIRGWHHVGRDADVLDEDHPAQPDRHVERVS